MASEIQCYPTQGSKHTQTKNCRHYKIKKNSDCMHSRMALYWVSDLITLPTFPLHWVLWYKYHQAYCLVWTFTPWEMLGIINKDEHWFKINTLLSLLTSNCSLNTLFVNFEWIVLSHGDHWTLYSKLSGVSAHIFNDHQILISFKSFLWPFILTLSIFFCISSKNSCIYTLHFLRLPCDASLVECRSKSIKRWIIFCESPI